MRQLLTFQWRCPTPKHNRSDHQLPLSCHMFGVFLAHLVVHPARVAPCPTVSHGVGVGQAEAGQVYHAIGQVDVEAAHGGLEVAELVQDHHAALHHRQRRGGGAAPLAFPIHPTVHAVFDGVLLCKVPEEGQLLQPCYTL